MSKTRQVVIVHGAYGYPGENWFPWLKGQLEANGCSVVVPAFPTPEGQSLQSWMDVFDQAVPSVGSSTILVGHSTGSLLVLRELEKVSTPVAGAFLISTFAHALGKPEFDAVNETFYSGGFDWEAIKRSAPRMVVYHADNDPYVPLEFGQEVASNAGAELVVVPGAGHFNAAAGYTKFDRLLEDVLTIG